MAGHSKRLESAVDPESTVNDGEILRILIIGSKEWVHRKVQRYGFAVPGIVRVENILDLTLDRRLAIPGTHKRLVVPISLVAKIPLLAFEASSPSGGSMAILRAAECTDYAQKMMLSVLEHAKVSLIFASPDEKPLAFIDCDEAFADAKLKFFRRRINTSGATKQGVEIVMQMARLLAYNRLLLAEFPVTSLEQRCTVAFSYSLELKARRGIGLHDFDKYQFVIDDPGFASSLHQEVMNPAELKTSSIFIEYSKEDGRLRQAFTDGGSANRIAHVYARDVPRISQASLEFRLRPNSTGLLNFTWMSLAVIGLLTLFMIIVRFGETGAFLRLDWLQTNSAAVVLVGPALLLSWLARAPEHAVVTRALTRLRIVNVLLAGSLLAVAAAVSIAWERPIWNLTWILSYVFYGVALLLSLTPVFFRQRQKSRAALSERHARTEVLY